MWKVIESIPISFFLIFSDQRHGNSTVFDHPIIGFDHQPQLAQNNGRSTEQVEKEISSIQESKVYTIGCLQ